MFKIYTIGIQRKKERKPGEKKNHIQTYRPCSFYRGQMVWGWGGLVAELCPTLATPWTVACQAPMSMEFSRQEYWSGLPFFAPGDLPDPGIEPGSPALQAYSY